MRFFLIALVILGGWVIGDTAIKSMKEVTNQRNAQICQIDPTLCQSTKWTHLPLTGHFCVYNKNMNNKELKSFYNGQVLMNETASKDPVVRAALDAMARRNFETLEVPTGGTWYISDRH